MNQKKVILIIIALFILLSPKVIDFIKNINNSNKIKEFKEINYSSGSKIIDFKDGILLYDGKSLSYIDCNAEKQFSFNVVLSNYNIDTNNQDICILDKNENELYIINSSGGLINRIKFQEKTEFVKVLKSGFILVQYSTQVDVEGVKMIDASGKEINNISIPKISINFISEDNSSGFLISGISESKDKLINNLFYYNSKGELIFSNSVENKMFIKAVFIGNNIYLLDSNYCEIRGKDFKLVNKINFDDSAKFIRKINDSIAIVENNNKCIIIDKNGDEKFLENTLESVKGFDFINKQYIVYSDRSVYLQTDRKKIDFTNDITDILSINDKYLIIIFRDSIKFYKVG